ncbi:MAG: hypothetical protein ACPGSD_11570 [Flavobacteriales bacterium]
MLKAIFLVMLTVVLNSCSQNSQPFTSSEYNVYYYKEDPTKVRRKTFVNNKMESGWYFEFNLDGTVKEEGLVLSDGKFSKHYCYINSDNVYVLKSYFTKNHKKKLQQIKFFNEDLNKIDSIGSYIKINYQNEDLLGLGYFSFLCEIDSIKIWDKEKNVYLSSSMNGIHNVEISNSLKNNYLLEYFCGVDSNSIRSRNIIFNLDYGLFNGMDLDYLKYLSEVRKSNWEILKDSDINQPTNWHFKK